MIQAVDLILGALGPLSLASQELLQLIIGRNDRQWRLELMAGIGDKGTLLVIIADKGPDGQAREDGHHHHKGQPADGCDLDRED